MAQEGTGLFPSLVALTLKSSQTEQSITNTVLSSINLETDDLNRTSPLHISLSRVFLARQWHIEPIVLALRSALIASSVDFSIELENLTWLENEDGPQFLVSPVSNLSAIDHLSRLTKTVDGVLQEYGHPPFFEPPIYHMSFLSTSKTFDVSQHMALSLNRSQFALTIKIGGRSYNLEA